MTREELLRGLPAIHELVALAAERCEAPRWAVVEAARRAVASRREQILGGTATDPVIGAGEVAAAATVLARPTLRRVVNATGVVLHTNLGRAPLAAAALAAVAEVGAGYSTLEYDLAAGARGSRHGHAAGLLRDLTGAEDAVVVNNNAAATVLALSALADGREVVVSRGELVEIGGSYRIPDILRLSGCKLVEVGTTNRTRIGDYEAAIGPATGMLLKVHASNFAMVGFTEAASIEEVVALARRRGVTAAFDLGSGALMEEGELRALGLPDEPTVRAVVAAGVDLACFSGDKLLGGPQAGILVGRRDAIARCRAHPLMRAVRPDKLTLAALGATLALLREGRGAEVPARAMLGATDAVLHRRAAALRAAIGEVPGVAVTVERTASAVGGGAAPLAELPSWALVVAVDGTGADAVDAMLRAARVPVVARVVDGRVVLDVRTILDADDEAVVTAVRGMVDGPR